MAQRGVVTINPPATSEEAARVSAAIHEISHAEVARKLGFTVTTIELDGHAQGFIKVANGTDTFDRMIVGVAGYLGQGLWMHRYYGGILSSQGRFVRHCQDDWSRQDMQEITRLGKKLSISTDKAEREAEKILKATRGKRERLAVKLARKGKLSPFWDL